ncbi:glucose dehydrogenase [Gordoniibacillus kamchatkensis]|uniref:Glucose dehydrogenase n=1 Tax=Gordoniibacillus kamchatkensis TaxID=1590651 RepID=A0ABR5AFK4_9BACL|nr:glucose 1-dehydrogenase [Paenibacillus sp. VKM B-2647]KIL39824.1 glucose dehydrogenase [Paenibacillus sp. VKM B-2647]
MKAVRVLNVQSEPKIAVVDVPEPERRWPGDVKVRVLCIGLDGTDKEILTEHYGMPPQGETDLTNGHESLGVVVEADEAAALAPGDLVTALVRRPCSDPACVNCRNERADYCESGQYTERGIKGRHGYLSEFYVEDARYLVKVPPSCLAYGMLAEPQSIVEKVWDQVQHIQQRLVWEPRTALVLGSGPLGLLAAWTCRCLGLDTYVWSKPPETSLSAELVRAAGAQYKQAGGGSATDGAGGSGSAAGGGSTGLKDYAAQLGGKIDLIFECTGYSPLAFEAIDALGPNGVLALLGVTAGERKLEIPSDRLNEEIVLENKCIIGSVNASRKNFETGLYRLQQMEEKFPGLLARMVTNRLTMDQLPGIDFGGIEIKAVVDIVPPVQWGQLVSEAAGAAYSFSV